MAATPEGAQLRVGRLTKAHGLKGAIKIELYTDDPERRFVPGAQFSLQVPEDSAWFGKTLEVAELRWYNGHPVAFFVGVDDRTAAESLIKAILWIDQNPDDEAPEDDAWYAHQLAGLSVERDGVKIGTVARIEHFPAQDLLVVKTAKDEVMVPFVSAIVPNVDIEKGVVTITPPLGLFEDAPVDEATPETGTETGSDTEKGSDTETASGTASDTDGTVSDTTTE